MRLRSVTLLAIAVLATAAIGCRAEDAGSGGETGDVGGASSPPALAAYRAHPGDKPVEIIDAVGLSVRAGCRTYRTYPGTDAFLLLSAATDLEDTEISVRFETDRFGEEEIYSFSPRGFSPEYGWWDVIGGEQSRVRGLLKYRTANEESVTVRFQGSGGRKTGSPCRLETSTVVASGAEAAAVRTVAEPDVPIDRGWVPPVVLGPKGGVLRPCEVGPRGGGHDLWIKDITCEYANAWLRRLVSVVGPQGQVGGYGRLEGGWECWSRLERKWGPIHNICVRGDQLVMFYFS